MTDLAGIDWEDAFSNGAYIDGADGYPTRWASQAAAFRAEHTPQVDIPYGDHPRERFDLFLPPKAPKGLAVIVHGGFWLAFDKSSWSDLAAGALALGWAVAMPSYILAPEATLPQMTDQIGRAVQVAASRVPGPVRLAGHSAGGHLVTRLASQTGPLPSGVSGRIDRVLSISGLHDLRPLMLHSMNEKLGLTAASAAAESAVLTKPLSGITAIAWVGADERPEFLRQSALLRESWGASLFVDPGKHHFDVIDGLKDPRHPLTLALVGD